MSTIYCGNCNYAFDIEGETPGRKFKCPDCENKMSIPEKEIRYHLRHNVNWLVRLGDGTDESHEKVQGSVDDLWVYTGEMFAADEIDQVFRDEFDGPDLEAIQKRWIDEIAAVLKKATLNMPEDGWMASGGKEGRHTEHLGYMIAEMQYLQRTHPGASW